MCCYLDEAFELIVLCQELCLFLLQGEDIVCGLLQDGRLAGRKSKGRFRKHRKTHLYKLASKAKRRQIKNQNENVHL